jgi:hypothetical protein
VETESAKKTEFPKPDLSLPIVPFCQQIVCSYLPPKVNKCIIGNIIAQMDAEKQ